MTDHAARLDAALKFIARENGPAIAPETSDPRAELARLGCALRATTNVYGPQVRATLWVGKVTAELR